MDKMLEVIEAIEWLNEATRMLTAAVKVIGVRFSPDERSVHVSDEVFGQLPGAHHIKRRQISDNYPFIATKNINGWAFFCVLTADQAARMGFITIPGASQHATKEATTCAPS